MKIVGVAQLSHFIVKPDFRSVDGEPSADSKNSTVKTKCKPSLLPTDIFSVCFGAKSASLTKTEYLWSRLRKTKTASPRFEAPTDLEPLVIISRDLFLFICLILALPEGLYSEFATISFSPCMLTEGLRPGSCSIYKEMSNKEAISG
jgi:hypothetical protein